MEEITHMVHHRQQQKTMSVVLLIILKCGNNKSLLSGKLLRNNKIIEFLTKYILVEPTLINLTREIYLLVILKNLKYNKTIHKI